MRPSNHNHNHNDQFNFKIVEIPSPYGKSIRCAQRDFAIVAINKITIYGTGKVRNLTDSEQDELAKLDDERTGRSGPKAQREFSRTLSKQRRLKTLERKKHNYLRSQGNLKCLLKVGMNPNSQSDAYQIIDHLLTEANGLGLALMEVGQKVIGHRSRIEGPFDRMKILSSWGMKAAPKGKKIFYLETIIYQAS